MKDLKKHASLDEQIEKLAARGLIITNPDEARKILFRINYYRLTGYLYSFKQKEDDRYLDGASMERIKKIYDFDRKFTRILLYALEDIEETLKTRISYTITSHYPSDPLIYTKADIYRNAEPFQRFLRIFYREVENNKELPFIKHHFIHYGGALPMWVAVEIMTMGNLRAIYDNLKGNLQKEIARAYHTGPVQFSSWIENLTYTRNHLAHYMRIWNFNFGRSPAKCKNHDKGAPVTQMIFDQICAMANMYSDVQEWNDYIIPEMDSLFCEYQDVVSLSALGFPENWKQFLSIESLESHPHQKMDGSYQSHVKAK